MSKLRRYNDNTPVEFSKEEKTAIIKKINEMASSLIFLRDNIQEYDGVTKNSIWTVMGLNEHYHADLSKMVHYDSILADELKERHKEIKEKNQEIYNLTNLLGKGVSPQAVSGALRQYEEIFRAWYESEGWHYASLEKFNQNGIIVELSSDLDYERGKNIADEDMLKLFLDKNKGTENKIAEGWDVYKDTYHAELLDTDNNKKRFTELLLLNFPGSRIFKFNGRKNDNNGYSLRIELYVPYENLEALYKSKLPEKLS